MHWRPSNGWMNRSGGARCARAAALACLLLVLAMPGECAGEADLARPNAETGPTRVWLSLYLADFAQVIATEQVFLGDVVLQAEWIDPRLAGRWPTLHGMALDEVWNPRLQIVNQRGVLPSFPQRVEIEPSGRVHYRQRWVGRFLSRMDLMDFPLDQQRFSIQVVTMAYSRDEIDLVVNSPRLPSGRAVELTVTDWRVGPVEIASADLAPVPGVRPLAGASLHWDGDRDLSYYAVAVILPLVLIALMGWLAFWVNPHVVQARVSLAMTTMLTLIADRFSLGRSVPSLSYLTRFDYFMLGSLILVFLGLLGVAAGAYLVGQGKQELVQRADRWARVVFPAALAAVFAISWWG